MMRKSNLFVALSCFICAAANADIRDFVPTAVLQKIAAESSGEAARRNLDTITLQHRMRASAQFDTATAHILEMLRRLLGPETARETTVARGTDDTGPP
jgi:hypothetical protein